MNLLFLRGQVPVDRDPRQIMYDKLNDCCDMWTQLASAMVGNGDYGEIWYWGGKRRVTYRDNLVERWVSSFKGAKPKFEPDVIFARGGFSQYDPILLGHPKAFRIYYGAGKRIYPQKGMFSDFDLILNDTPQQAIETMKAFPKAKVRLWTKPAAENIFYPDLDAADKPYDVIMVGNEDSKGRKGHDLVLGELQNRFNVLQVGISSPALRRRYPNVVHAGWIARREIRVKYAMAKISVVACSERDSCPRVVPESLACGCPLLLSSRVNVWREKYIHPAASRLFSESSLSSAVESMIGNIDSFQPSKYYSETLSMEKAVEQIRKHIMH